VNPRLHRTCPGDELLVAGAAWPGRIRAGRAPAATPEHRAEADASFVAPLTPDDKD
jgi:hypothetical protein